MLQQVVEIDWYEPTKNCGPVVVVPRTKRIVCFIYYIFFESNLYFFLSLSLNKMIVFYFVRFSKATETLIAPFHIIMIVIFS